MRLPILMIPACLALHAQDAVDTYLKQQMARSRIPGLAVAIVREGRLEKLSAYGQASLELGAPLTADSAFQIASATKLFTGVLAMSLVAEGKLDLDAPISRYLGKVPAAWEPTPRA
jgi:CubicO group peptidase (beta-lactamase class C family)